jgi:hypothetical protein
MKKIINTLISLFLINGAMAQDIRTLNVLYNHQESTNWCWAACCQSVLAYYGQIIAQCDVAETARVLDYRVVNQYRGPRFGGTYCCNLNNGCNCTNYMDSCTFSAGSISLILKYYGIMKNYSVESPISYDVIKNEINSWRPVVFQWAWVAGGGHFLVIRGYNTSNNLINYIDPNDGYQTMTYQWVVSNSLSSWIKTLVFQTNPSCGHSQSYFSQPITNDITSSETDYIEISSSISNNANVNINFGKECLINNGFGIATGSSLTILPSSTLNCN